MTIKLHIWPEFSGEDQGDGGVRRVVEGQRAHLPASIELVARAEDADVIASHISIPKPYPLRFPEKPIVAHCHGLYWSEFEWATWALKTNGDVMDLIRMADIVTAPTEWVAQAIRRHTSRDVRVVPHGIDAAEWQQRESGGYILWNKTRPDPVCDPGPMNALAALLPDIEFRTTFGDARPNVTVTGRLPHAQAKEEVERAAAYLCTAKETFGIGTLEALAAGVPVVGWRWGGQAEIIEHGIDGWLAAPGDFESLAEGARWAVERRAELSPACRRKAAEYPWERAAGMYAGIFEEALAHRGAPMPHSGIERHPVESSMPRPRTSIIVTAYNLDQYLDECLRSVAAQTDPDIECVIVDDASPDRCGEIADAWAAKDTRFRVLHNERNLYLAGARNAGIEQARGRFILPLDADDWLAPEAVEILARALDADRSIHVAYGNVEFVEPDGRRWHSGWPMDFRHDWQLSQRNLLPYCSMFRREAWALTGGYRARFRTAEDADFWCRLSSYGFRPRRVTQMDTLIYRNREGSMSRVEEPRDWTAWFPWSRDPDLAPAGAATEQQLPVPAIDPPAVSVVIPCGPGHEDLLIDAVDSVDAQTFRGWECVVVNDTGGALPHLPTWVRVIEQDWSRMHAFDVGTGADRGDVLARYGGVAAARNAGIAAARAPLYLPLDADDYLQPRALELMLRAHRDRDDAPIIYSDFWEDPDEEGVFRVWETPPWRCDKLISDGALHAVTALTPVAVWKECGGYDERLPGWEDWAFQIAAAERRFCSARLPLPLFTYRKHTGKRRNENVTDFERSKSGILSKYGEYWNGGKTMGCAGCGGGSSPPPVAQGFAPQQSSGPPPEGAVLLAYDSDREGAATFRGPSGRSYRFGNGDARYVLSVDAPHLLNIGGFHVLKGEALPALDSAPSLVAAQRMAEPIPPAEQLPPMPGVQPPLAEQAADPLAAVAVATDAFEAGTALADAAQDGIAIEAPPGASLDELASMAPKKGSRAKSQ